jgi:hypothetical protein
LGESGFSRLSRYHSSNENHSQIWRVAFAEMCPHLYRVHDQFIPWTRIHSSRTSPPHSLLVQRRLVPHYCVIFHSGMFW